MQITIKLHSNFTKLEIYRNLSLMTLLFHSPLSTWVSPITPNHHKHTHPMLNAHYFFLYVKDTFFRKAQRRWALWTRNLALNINHFTHTYTTHTIQDLGALSQSDLSLPLQTDPAPSDSQTVALLHSAP